MHSEILYSIALRSCPKIGDSVFSKLLQHFGSAKTVWETSKNDLENVFGIGSAISRHIGKNEILDFAHKELCFCEKNKIEVLIEKSNDFPYALRNIPDLPSIIYKKGELNVDKNYLSIVGTRNSTNYGKSFLKQLFEVIKNHNFCIISGLALGTDAYAHQLALDYDIPTIGVLAHGLHTLYPAANKKMSNDILEKNGALLTEFNSSQNGIKQNFIQRNRIIAGLSPITIVVESAYGGGSMSTANFAHQYDREIFALPGRIDDKYSQGCNKLIAQQIANILYNPQMVLNCYKEKQKPDLFSNFLPEISNIELKKPTNHLEVYQLISEQPLICLNELSFQLEMPSHQLLPILLNFELEGYISTNSSKQFQIIK